MPSDASEARENGGAYRLRLVLVLVVLVGLIACERVAQGLRLPFYKIGPSTTGPGVFALEAVQGSGCLAAGLLIDAYGTKRVVALALIGWSVLTSAVGAIMDPLAVRGVDLAIALGYGAFMVAPSVAIKRHIPSGRTALPLMVAIVASYVWVAFVPGVKWFITQTMPADGDYEEKRLWVAMVLAAAGAFIALVWLIGFPNGVAPVRREHSLADRFSRLVANRGVWSLMVISGLGIGLVEIGEHRLFRFLARERSVDAATVGVAIYYPYVAAAAGALGAAVWSDRIFRMTGSLTRARRPFAIGAFVAAAAIGSIPLVRQSDTVAMSCIAAAGIGMQMIIAVVIVDIAPPGSVGMLAGLLCASDSLVRFGVDEAAVQLYAFKGSFVPILLVASGLALAGAIATAVLLRRIVPLETPHRDLPSLFG